MADWQWASDFLARGRKKYERPLYDRGLRIWKEHKWVADSPINIGWKYSLYGSVFITFYKDGTTTIRGNNEATHGWGNKWMPLKSQSVRLTIQRYANIKVVQKDFKFYLEESGAPLTPAKIQNCRKCKGSGKVDGWCGVYPCWKGSWYEANDEAIFACPDHPEAEPATNHSSYHNLACEHGNLAGHNVLKGMSCYCCNGSGKRDYGSKPERTQWDGSPIRIRDGKLIKSIPSLLERMVADNVEPID